MANAIGSEALAPVWKMEGNLEEPVGAWLVCVSPGRGDALGVERAFVPFGHQCVVGAAPGCDMVISSRFVSRRHAIFRPAKGKIDVEDLNSTNGVMVEGRKVARRQLAAMPALVSLAFNEVAVLPAYHCSGAGPLAMICDLVAASKAMMAMMHSVLRAARGRESVIVQGAPGSGTTSVARAIHLQGDRRHVPPVGLPAIARMLSDPSVDRMRETAFRADLDRLDMVLANRDVVAEGLDRLDQASLAALDQLVERIEWRRAYGGAPASRIVATASSGAALTSDADSDLPASFHRLDAARILVPRATAADLLAMAWAHLARHGRSIEPAMPADLLAAFAQSSPASVRKACAAVIRSSASPVASIEDLAKHGGLGKGCGLEPGPGARNAKHGGLGKGSGLEPGPGAQAGDVPPAPVGGR